MIIFNMFYSNFRGSPHLARVYTKPQHVSCAIDTCVHENSMQKKEEEKISSMNVFKSLFRKHEFKIHFNYKKAIKIDVSFKIKIISGNCLTKSLVILSLRAAGSQPVMGADNCPPDTSETSVSNTPPRGRHGNPSQHPGWGWGSQPCLHTIIYLLIGDIDDLNDLNDLVVVLAVLRTGSQSPYISIGGDVSVLGGLGGFGHAPAIITIISVCRVIGGLGGFGHAPISLIGDSNSPMPSPVGGILDTPIVTFLSRIPVDLSLWINDYDLVTLSTWSTGLRVNADSAAVRTNPNWFNHSDKRHALDLTDVIDKLFGYQLISLLSPITTIYHFLSLFLPSQVKEIFNAGGQMKQVIDSYTLYSSIM